MGGDFAVLSGHVLVGKGFALKGRYRVEGSELGFSLTIGGYSQHGHFGDVSCWSSTVDKSRVGNHASTSRPRIPGTG
jgi:hypothetical protein